MDFKDWLWDKFVDWRGKTDRGITDFAEYIGVSQPTMSGWIKGGYGPRGKNLAKLAKKYPDVYEALGLPNSPLEKLPLDFRKRLLAAMTEADKEVKEQNVVEGSPEAERIRIVVFAKFGFQYTETVRD